MADIPERLTERARRVLTLAGEEAVRSGETMLDPICILLGLIRIGDGVAFRVLGNLGVNTQDLLIKIRMTLEGHEWNMECRPELTEASKLLLEDAANEVRGLKHHYIGTEHLLLALTRNQGEAGRALSEQGVSYAKVRHEVRRILSQGITN